MADLSKIKLSGTIYSLKDNEARTAVTALQTAVASSLVFKGTVSSAADFNRILDSNYEVGWTYRANAAFTISDLGKVETGDMIICIRGLNSPLTKIGGMSTILTDYWTVVQNNVDTMVGATSAAAGTRGLVPAPAAGDSEKYLKGDGTWGSPSSESSWGTFTDLS